MAIRSEQILLDDPLYYTGNPTLTNDQSLVDIDYADVRSDRSLKTIHRVPDGEVNGANLQFTTPTAFQLGSVEVFFHKKLFDPSALTYPDSSTVRFPVAPVGPPLEIRYLPEVGVATGRIGRTTTKSVSSSGTLTLDDVDSRVVVVDTSGGPVALVLPSMVGMDGVVTSFVVIGGAVATLQADVTDTIDGESGPVTLSSAKKMVYVEARNEWLSKRMFVDPDLSFKQSPTHTEGILPVIPEF